MAGVSIENWKETIRDPKIECMGRDEMNALQSERLIRQVKNVYEHVEFYRKKMDSLGIEPGDIKGIEDIHKLPFTTKEDLRDNYPFGLLAVPKEKIARVQGTSGTTGKLTLASYTQKDVDVWGECVARGLVMAGLSAADRIHVCYGYGLFTGGMGLDLGAQALGAMAIPMSSGNTKRQLMCMEDFGATAFACTPSYALYLAEAAQEAGVVDRLQIKASINGAEPWTDEMRKKIEPWTASTTKDCMYTRIISIRKYLTRQTSLHVGTARQENSYSPLWQKKECPSSVTGRKTSPASSTAHANVEGHCQESRNSPDVRTI